MMLQSRNLDCRRWLIQNKDVAGIQNAGEYVVFFGQIGDDRKISERKNIVYHFTVAVKNGHKILSDTQLDAQLFQQPDVTIQPVGIITVISRATGLAFA